MSALLLLITMSIPAPFEAPPVADTALATLRGGFRLPSGIDVALTVQSQSVVDGAVVLRTVFQVDHGAPVLTIFAPKAGETVKAPDNAGASGASTISAPVVTYDNRTGISIVPGAGGPAVSVSSGSVATAASDVPAGLGPVVVGQDGFVTDKGVITQSPGGSVQTVTFNAADLTITHFVGNAFGTAIANSGGDRTIDTQTTIGIDLGNAGPDVLGSAMFRAEDVALGALQARLN